MSLSIKVKRPGDLGKALTKARSEAKKYKIAFAGDERTGYGRGRGFDISYTVLTDGVSFTLHKKPLIYPDAMVVKKFKEFWSEYLKEECG